MSTRPPNNSFGPLDQLAMRYLRYALDTAHPIDEPYVLNPTESRLIRRTKVMTLSLAAMLGVLGVLMLYIPQYNWPYLFTDTSLTVFGTNLQIPLLTILYGLLVVYVEVNMLIALNLVGVKAIMQVCQFPKSHDAQYDRHVQALAQAALADKSRGMLRFGVEPYLNLPRWGLPMFFLINMVKAALSNLSVRILFARLTNSLVLRQVTDLAGMPIYAAWNAYATWQVLREAQIRVMAPSTIREFVNELYDEWGDNEQFRPLILEALQYMAVLDRQYNYAHFMLTETLTDRFGLSTRGSLTGHFAERAALAPVNVRRSLERLVVFGALVDGRLSWIEKRRFGQLRKKGFLTYTPTNIDHIGKEYNQGRGLWV